jgi:predicted AlkP superfamily phosphohydrolase/phosphomutase
MFWADHDENHPRHNKESIYKNVIKNYYKMLDNELGDIIRLLPADTTIIVVSDHGMTGMEKRFNLNDWLLNKGYLVLKKMPDKPTKLDFNNVDWERTSAYAVGAYFGRIHFNGIKNKSILRNSILNGLLKAGDSFYIPEIVYKGKYLDEAPDLYIYFNNQRIGVNNDVGNDGEYSDGTTEGVDDANHAPKGIFIINRPGYGTEEIEITDVYDVIKKELKK